MPQQKNSISLILFTISSILFLSAPKSFAMSGEVRSMCEQAEQLINAKNFNQAVKILKKANKLEPNTAEVYGYLGMAYQNSLKTQKAVHYYKQALELNPSMSFININLGTCYMNLSQPEKAVPYFRAYLKSNPNAPNRSQIEGYIRQSGNRVGQMNTRSSFEQGQRLLTSGKNQEALRIFQNIVSRNPNFAPAHFYLGYAWANLGNHSLAIKEFKQSLSLDPSQKESLINIGSNYQSMGNIEQAIAWYQRYLNEFPNSAKARNIQNRITGLKKQASKNQISRNPAQRNRPYQSGQNRAIQWSQRNNLQPEQRPQAYYQYPGNNVESRVNTNQSSDYLASASSNGKFFKWPVNAMPIGVFIASGNSLKGFNQSFIRIFNEALKKWSMGSGQRLTFRLASRAKDANITCYWTDNPDQILERGKSIEGGLTKISGSLDRETGNVFIKKAKVTILTVPRDNSEKLMSEDEMMKVCLHELGHALGINGHSNNNKDIMFYSESPSIWPALTKRDKATIKRLYLGYPRQQQN